jgi:hypothetical protein
MAAQSGIEKESVFEIVLECAKTRENIIAGWEREMVKKIRAKHSRK